jgi:hypothetical protein
MRPNLVGSTCRGTVLLGLGLAALLAGLVEGRTGWTHWPTILLLGAGVVVVVGFVVVEHQVAHPILDPMLFRGPDFVAATVTALASGAGVLSLMSFIPTLMQRGLGDANAVAATTLLAWSGVGVLTVWPPGGCHHRCHRGPG